MALFCGRQQLLPSSSKPPASVDQVSSDEEEDWQLTASVAQGISASFSPKETSSSTTVQFADLQQPRTARGAAEKSAASPRASKSKKKSEDDETKESLEKAAEEDADAPLPWEARAIEAGVQALVQVTVAGSDENAVRLLDTFSLEQYLRGEQVLLALLY